MAIFLQKDFEFSEAAWEHEEGDPNVVDQDERLWCLREADKLGCFAVAANINTYEEAYDLVAARKRLSMKNGVDPDMLVIWPGHLTKILEVERNRPPSRAESLRTIDIEKASGVLEESLTASEVEEEPQSPDDIFADQLITLGVPSKLATLLVEDIIDSQREKYFAISAIEA